MTAARRLLSIAAAASSLWLPAASPAEADVLVLYSSASGFARGDRLSDDTVLEVPAGKLVRILRPAGGTQEIVGPQRRLVRDITRGESVNETAWREMLDQITREREGGATAGTRGAGATRGGSR